MQVWFWRYEKFLTWGIFLYNTETEKNNKKHGRRGSKQRQNYTGFTQCVPIKSQKVQKQPFADAPQKKCSGLRLVALLKKRFRQWYYPVKFSKFEKNILFHITPLTTSTRIKGIIIHKFKGYYYSKFWNGLLILIFLWFSIKLLFKNQGQTIFCLA